MITKKQFAAAVAAGHMQESFTYRDEDGTETTYHVTKMREYVQRLKPDLVPLNQTYIDQMRESRDWDAERVNDPTLDVDDPVIMVMYPPTDYSNGHPVIMLLDGIHRLLRRWDVLGLKNIPAYIVHPMECILVDPTDYVAKDVWGEKDFERNAAERIKNKEQAK